MNIHIKKAIKALKKNDVKTALKILKSKDIIYITWTLDDVMDYAELTGYKITKKDARCLLEDFEENHDPEYGLSFEDLNAYLQHYSET